MEPLVCQTTQEKPSRVVILGSNGVIGKALIACLEKEGINYLPIGRDKVDLTHTDSADVLSNLLESDDQVVFLSTLTPDKGKGTNAFMQNVSMSENVCKALQKQPVSQIIYLSSDTVYPIDGGIVNEKSSLDPENLFGVMHLSRETMLKEAQTSPLAVLRSTLVYAFEDTHNSYGPNRMRRQAQNDHKIPLFGGGEEKRDHIYVHDLAKLIYLTLSYKAVGALNLVTGSSISYHDLAVKISKLYDFEVKVETSVRQNPITHRHFDASHIYKVFPQFCFKELDAGLEEIHEQENLTLANLAHQ